jgi:uncharacterized membrane protein YcjF (UPF0283 family)
MTMKANESTTEVQLALFPLDRLEAAEEWVRKAFSEENLAAMGMIASTLLVVGYLVSVLHRAFQAYTIIGV